MANCLTCNRPLIKKRKTKKFCNKLCCGRYKPNRNKSRVQQSRWRDKNREHTREYARKRYVPRPPNFDPNSNRGQAIAEGLRSGFERTLVSSLKTRKVDYQYEPTKLPYVLHHNYVPDFYLAKQNIYIEAKGKLTPEDRTKMLAVKKQYPDLDIRFVFMRGSNKLSSKPKSKTYMEWAESNGFLAADGEIPEEWLKLT